ncbi:hypothetical protein PROFUN_00363 [Planoprotostelium fungivorum]|uniref:Uncharacterized protein n=1 Tax=Planoprotostelium fungivorum TaxID=1890364 RepID=A0A2P6NY70_9EUKA|nr:hypothetical protein PROFUN_00363 [Planoprotostelium fungivorum]
MSNQITLYDLPNKNPDVGCWSPNTWKARAALNFKGLDYKTEWISYPDITPKLTSFGVPGDDNWPHHTLPAISYSDDGKTSFKMDSARIAAYLEELKPQPSLQLSDPTVEQVQHIVQRDIMGIIRPIMLPRVPNALLPPRDAQYFHETRTKAFGCTLEELLAKTDEEALWKTTSQTVRDKLVPLLKKSGGPFFLGEKASYADLFLGSFLAWFRVVDPAILERFLSFDSEGHLRTLWQAVQPFFERASF